MLVQDGTETHGGAGRRRRPRVAATLSEINVVPLVDVMLVLLIIFMVAAPMMTQGMQVNLPQARRAANPPVQNLYVTIPADFGTSNKVQINDDPPFSAGVLAERMRQALLVRTDKTVFIRADQGVTMQQFMTCHQVALWCGFAWGEGAWSPSRNQCRKLTSD